ncbi:hypothetical protein [Streptacidiphilus neutrinimicus]|uniref:hypothetical protein n=1 Tax=Streptacidiphilus neutrinimicus TaxID=105420 RepID=UPI0005AA9701|nr:hypothetical protein [Streptacidiphilus neutrinimicus]
MPSSTKAEQAVDLMRHLIAYGHVTVARRQSDGGWLVRRKDTGPVIALDGTEEALDFAVDTLAHARRPGRRRGGMAA